MRIIRTIAQSFALGSAILSGSAGLQATSQPLSQDVQTSSNPPQDEVKQDLPKGYYLVGLELEKIISKNQEAPFTKEEKQILRDNFWHPDVTAAVKSRRFIVETEDIVLSMNEQNSYFALGVPQNLTFPANDPNTKYKSKFGEFTTKEFFRAFFHSFYAQGYARNLTTIVEPPDIDLCRNEPDAAATYHFTQKHDYPLESPERVIVRTKPQLPFSKGVVRKPKYTVEDPDKVTGRNNQYEDTTEVLASKESWIADEADNAAVEEALERHLTSNDANGYVRQIVLKDSYKITPRVIEILRREYEIKNKQTGKVRAIKTNLNSDFAAVAYRPDYIKIQSEESIKFDIDRALQNPNSIFAEELFANPAIPFTKEGLLVIAASEEYFDTGIAEAIMERLDVPLAEEHKRLANEHPKSKFAIGMKTHLAIEELQKTILETNTVIAATKGKIITATTDHLMSAVKELIAQVDRNIEDAKAEHEPSKVINDIRTTLEIAKQIIEKEIGPTIEEVTKATFGEKVLESKLPVLVDLWAPWCEACKELEPTIQEIAKKYDGKLKVLKLNVDENPVFKVTRFLPTLWIFKDGKHLGEIDIEVPKPELFDSIEKHLKN